MFRSYTEERLERPLSNFTDVNPFVADENFGDAAIGWVMGRIAGTLAQMPVLGHSHAAYMIVRGIEAAAKGKDVFKADKNKKTTLNSIFALPADIKGNGDKVFATQLRALSEVHARDRGGGQGQQRQDRLLPPAGAELGQDADGRGEARGRRQSRRSRPLSPHGRGHADPARSRHGGLRPRRHARRTCRRRSTPTTSISSADDEGRQQGLPDDGRSSGRQTSPRPGTSAK